MIQFLFDEDVTPALRAAANQRGYHAHHVQYIGWKGRTDVEILQRMIDQDLTLVTGNWRDFRALLTRREVHPGMISLPDVPRAEQIRLFNLSCIPIGIQEDHMPKSVQIRARADANTKQRAEEILSELGLTPSAAINLFYRQIIMRRALPFPVAVPNDRTRTAVEQARSGEGVTEAKDLPALLAKLLSRRERTFDVAELAAAAPELLAAAEKVARGRD